MTISAIDFASLEMNDQAPLGTSTAPAPTAKTDPERGSGSSSKAQQPSATRRLLAIASEHVVTVKSTEGAVMAASATVPYVVSPLEAKRPQALVPVFLQYAATYGVPAPSEAMKAVRTSLEYHAEASDPVEVRLRVAKQDGVIWIDTGWADGSVIRIARDGWSIEQECPAYFKRSRVSGSVPDPRGVTAALTRLSRYVNAKPEDLPLIYSVLMTSWFTGVPQPIFGLLGGPDSGKTTAMGFLVNLADPSLTQPGGPLTKDPRTMKALSGVRHILCFENVSYVDNDTSDMLCVASTGTELATRELFTDDGHHITQVMCPVWLNGIMAGFTRADLASRAVVVELESVSPAQRRAMEDLKAGWASDRAAIFAGLLDLTVQVLATRDSVAISGEHRSAEFERNLAAIDAILGTSGCERLAEQSRDLAVTVLDASTFGMVLRRAVESARSCRQPSLFAELLRTRPERKSHRRCPRPPAEMRPTTPVAETSRVWTTWLLTVACSDAIPRSS